VPRWAEAGDVSPRTEIPEQYLCLQEVGHLALGDARAYLQKVGVGAGPLQESLLDYASVDLQVEPAAREVHPLHLGLCADVVLEAQASGQTLDATDFASVPEFEAKGRVLVERLLRYVTEDLRYAIDALSACRAFDKEIFRLLGGRLNFNTEETTFKRLTSFSFVWQDGWRGENWYRIHDLLRRFDSAAEVEHAHRLLAEHYQEQSDIEAIFHINRFDWSRGVDLWVETFDKALELSRYELCQALLDIRGELEIATPFKLGQVSHSEGKYFQGLALYNAALQEYREAIAAYDAALQRAPDDVGALNNKGNALRSLADLQAGLSQHEQALTTYRDSIAAYDAALQRAPDYVNALNNKGNALQSLADLQAGLSQHEQALTTYRDSIAACDAALQRAPDYVNALNNKGNALRSLGFLLLQEGQFNSALSFLGEALALWQRNLELAPGNTRLLEQRDRLVSQLEDWANSVRANIPTLSEESTGDLDVLLARCTGLNILANLQAALSRKEEVVETLTAAIATYETALALSPENLQCLAEIGDACLNIAILLQTDRPEDAEARARQALESWERAFELDPGNATLLEKRNWLQQQLDEDSSGDR